MPKDLFLLTECVLKDSFGGCGEVKNSPSSCVVAVRLGVDTEKQEFK